MKQSNQGTSNPSVGLWSRVEYLDSRPPSVTAILT